MIHSFSALAPRSEMSDSRLRQRVYEVTGCAHLDRRSYSTSECLGLFPGKASKKHLNDVLLLYLEIIG